jgi:hypothetical protein
MNKTPIFLLLLLVAAGAGTLGGLIGSRAEVPHRWEYDVSQNSEDLRRRGPAGWELVFVNVIPGTNGAASALVYCYRRPLKDK